MARNQEKAQSTLYRFRQAQAAELGLARTSDRRPRMASSVTNLRDCEKWRSEVLREISRKVSKIQDFNLSDFEVRDINDEINKLIREKSHWENQILALGGANYKRGTRMFDDSGKEVPGSRGYKYFGRAKDLPGVKELLSRTAEQEEEIESYKSQKYRRFANQPAWYYGDHDEDDGQVLASEAAAEEAAWRNGWQEIKEQLAADGEGQEAAFPAFPRTKPKSLKEIQEEGSTAPQNTPKAPKGKRKAPKQAKKSKKSKGQDGDAHEDTREGDEGEEEEEEEEGQGGDDEEMLDGRTAPKATGDAARAAAMLSVLDAREIQLPEVPDRAKTEAFILQARKRALREQCE
ncbi:hypothetical protein L7F22_016382 [Adiantum nelumboides]|nr:hypothetical protein [Adiantum nelumboides]